MDQVGYSKSKGFVKSFLNVEGTLLGSVLLLCGSSIGVGILPLPIITGSAGSLPTVIVFAICCIYMTITALLILETSLRFKDASFIVIAKSMLGRLGQAAVIFSFLFLFYSLTVAYLAKGGEIVHGFMQAQTTLSLPVWSGAFVLALASGILVLLGPFLVDHLNRVFFVGFLITYLFLSTSGISYAKLENITHYDWSLSLFIVPFIVISFGYHNLIPFVGHYLKQDRTKSIQAFIYTGIILFTIYVAWVLVLHSILPLEGSISIKDSFSRGEIVTEPLARLIHSPVIRYCAVYMAFFAIITSVLGQGLSIIDFLAEWTNFKKTLIKRALLCAMLFIPTFILSQSIPGVFFKALQLAGGIATLLIFGIIPSLLGWINRYKSKDTDFKPIVPGGKPMLVAVFLIASFIISGEVIKNFF